MKKCYLCGQKTDRYPYNKNERVLCYDCDKVEEEKKKPIDFKSKNRKGPLTIICNI